MSLVLANGNSSSHESLANAVRARVVRRMERPLSLADEPSLPALISLINSKAYSTGFDSAYFYDEIVSKDLPLSSIKKPVSESKSIGETEKVLQRHGPRRAASLVDFLFKRKRNRLNIADINIIENPLDTI